MKDKTCLLAGKRRKHEGLWTSDNGHSCRNVCNRFVRITNDRWYHCYSPGSQLANFITAV